MRILHVTPYLSPVFGGPSFVVKSMAECGSEEGHEVDVVSTFGGIEKRNNESTSLFNLQESKARFKLFPRCFPEGIFHSPSLNAWLRAHAKTYDLIHLHVPFTQPFRNAVLIADRLKIPFVVTPHGVFDQWSLRQKSWKKKPYFVFFEKQRVSRASVIHACSDLELTSLTGLDFGPPIRKVELAVYPPRWKVGERDELTEKRILFIGRLHPVKGIPNLLEALRILKTRGLRVYLDIAGAGDEKYENWLKGMVLSLGIADEVVWHGFVDQQKRTSLLARAYCLALVSLHESFGLVGAEALTMGVPLVVGDQVGISSRVHEFGAGEVVFCNKPIGIANAFARLLQEKENRDARAGALRLTQKHFGMHAFSKNLSAMYDEAITRI